MKAIVYNKKLLIAIALLLIVSSIIFYFKPAINKREIENLDKTSYENFTLYYEEKAAFDEVKDYDLITDRIYSFLINKLKLDLKRFKFNVFLLPLNNKVLDFEKQGSTATVFIDDKHIFIADFYNFPKEIYDKYGNPPEDIYYDAFVHELAHLFTYKNISYKDKNKLDTFELNSVFFTYIDFRKINLGPTPKLSVDIKANFSKSKYSLLKKDGLLSLQDATKDRTLAIFLYYLHSIEEHGKIKIFLESDDLSGFIAKTNWLEEDNKGFVNWLKPYIES